jgi:hypothetical protein
MMHRLTIFNRILGAGAGAAAGVVLDFATSFSLLTMFKSIFLGI